MDKIIEINGYYTSINFEGNLKKCSENLRTRLFMLGHRTYGLDNKSLSDEWSRIEKVPSGFHKCICGHSIKYPFSIVSNLTGNKVVIGSSCIKKFQSESLNDQLRDLKKIRCEVCDKSVLDIESHNNSNKHIMMLNSRECLGCTKRIMNTEPHWKVRCIKCYRCSRS